METVINPLRKLRAALGESTHQTDGNGVTRSDSKSGGTNAIGELYGRKWKTKWWSANLFLPARTLTRWFYVNNTIRPANKRSWADWPAPNILATLTPNLGFGICCWTLRCSYLTWTFKIPFGRFLFLVVPFGVVFAQEVFHRTILETFIHADGCETDIDDFLVWGSMISVLKKY